MPEGLLCKDDSQALQTVPNRHSHLPPSSCVDCHSPTCPSRILNNTCPQPQFYLLRVPQSNSLCATVAHPVTNFQVRGALPPFSTLLQNEHSLSIAFELDFGKCRKTQRMVKWTPMFLIPRHNSDVSQAKLLPYHWSVKCSMVPPCP